MSVLDQVAQLILKDPNITVKEIAAALGYAEEKSIYYWLQKAGFRGLRDFRKAVLKKTYTPQGAATDRGLSRGDSTPGALDPRVYTNTAPEPLEARDSELRLQDYLRRYMGPTSFCVILSSQDYMADQAEEVLVVDPEAPAGQGDMVLASVNGRMFLARRYLLPDRAPLYVDARTPNTLLSPDYVSGKVVFILKRLP